MGLKNRKKFKRSDSHISNICLSFYYEYYDIYYVVMYGTHEEMSSYLYVSVLQRW